MVMPGNVPRELHDEVPTRDRAPPGQQQARFKPLDLSVPGAAKPVSRLEQLGPVLESKDEFWQELKEIS